jgi:hypothetical protein
LSLAPPGVFDGIGDFAASLTAALSPHCDAELFVRAEHWSELTAVDPANTAGAIVQYLPQAFMRGDLRVLLKWLGRLRAANKPVVLVVHEYWPPQNGTLRRAAVRLLFRRILRACIRRSTAIVTSQEFSAGELRTIARGREIHAIPMGSSIPRIGGARTPDGACRLVLFGQPAAMHAPTMAALGAWLPSAPAGVSLTWLGRSSDEMREYWLRRWRLPEARITFSGGLAAADVSSALLSSHIGLAPYENGASARRTSFTALLEHQLPVVAVDGLYTSDWLRDSGACAWTMEGEPAAFVQSLAALIDDAPRRAALSAAAGKIFDERMSWTRIGDAYARLMNGACA